MFKEKLRDFVGELEGAKLADLDGALAIALDLPAIGATFSSSPRARRRRR